METLLKVEIPDYLNIAIYMIQSSMDLLVGDHVTIILVTFLTLVKVTDKGGEVVDGSCTDLKLTIHLWGGKLHEIYLQISVGLPGSPLQSWCMISLFCTYNKKYIIFIEFYRIACEESKSSLQQTRSWDETFNRNCTWGM